MGLFEQKASCRAAIQLCDLSEAETKALVRKYAFGAQGVSGSGGGRSLSFQLDFPAEVILDCLRWWMAYRFDCHVQKPKRRNRICVDMSCPSPAPCTKTCHEEYNPCGPHEDCCKEKKNPENQEVGCGC